MHKLRTIKGVHKEFNVWLDVISIKFLRRTEEDNEVSKRSLEIRTANQNKCWYLLVLLNIDLNNSNFKQIFYIRLKTISWSCVPTLAARVQILSVEFQCNVFGSFAEVQSPLKAKIMWNKCFCPVLQNVQNSAGL